MNNIAIISVVNNQKLADQMINSAINTAGGISCTFQTINNIDNKAYHSAAAAYNSVLDINPEAEVYVFCHQDIIFERQALSQIYNVCTKEKDTLFGAAGVENVGHGKKNRIISSMAMIQSGWNYKSLEKGTTKDVFTLDECLICGHRDLFKSLRFDEKVCDGWHLYAVELSLQCHVKGLKVKVFDADIVHLSGGNPDSSFYACEKKLVQKYHKHFSLISYSCGWTYTDPIRYTLLAGYRFLRYGVSSN